PRGSSFKVCGESSSNYNLSVIPNKIPLVAANTKGSQIHGQDWRVRFRTQKKRWDLDDQSKRLLAVKFCRQQSLKSANLVWPGVISQAGEYGVEREVRNLDGENTRPARVESTDASIKHSVRA